MRENRKIQIEVLDDGDTILSVNFDQDGSRHPMTVVRVCSDYRQASGVASELIRESDWSSSFMSGDGSVPVRWSVPKRDVTTDDIPF